MLIFDNGMIISNKKDYNEKLHGKNYIEVDKLPYAPNVEGKLQIFKLDLESMKIECEYKDIPIVIEEQKLFEINYKSVTNEEIKEELGFVGDSLIDVYSKIDEMITILTAGE